MLAALRNGADLAIGSRHVSGGSAAGLGGQWRHRMSDLATRIALTVLPVKLTDPMSGFFMIRAELFRELAPRLTGQGFKILLDLLLSSPRRLVVEEVPVIFRPRLAGESKLDILIALQFGGLLVDKFFRGLVPLRFLSFALVGSAGVVVHLCALDLARRAGIDFAWSQGIATFVAMLGNFYLNNTVTYRTVRLRGPALLIGLAMFVLVCSLGAIANVGIARMIYSGHGGWTPAGLIGALVGTVWNYAISATLVWNRRPPAAPRLSATRPDLNRGMGERSETHLFGGARK
jgi:dolichol-phosphate mannosyltransferase